MHKLPNHIHNSDDAGNDNEMNFKWHNRVDLRAISLNKFG